MYNEDKIVSTLQIIQDTCFPDINRFERLFVIANLLLMEAEEYLPSEIKKDAKGVLSNGKRVHYELLKYEDNFGLNLALKAHTMLARIQKEIDGDIDG